MRHLRLKKGLSYTGPGVRATKAAPDVFLEDDKTADAAIATGYFEEVEDGDVMPPRKSPAGTLEAMDTMGVTKLRAYAKEKGLDLEWPSGTDADAIREDIRRVLAEREAADDPPDGLFEQD